MDKGKKRIKRILEYKLRGYSLHAISKIFRISRERVRQLVEEYRNDPELKGRYLKLEELKKFIENAIENESKNSDGYAVIGTFSKTTEQA